MGFVTIREKKNIEYYWPYLLNVFLFWFICFSGSNAALEVCFSGRCKRFSSPPPHCQNWKLEVDQSFEGDYIGHFFFLFFLFSFKARSNTISKCRGIKAAQLKVSVLTVVSMSKLRGTSIKAAAPTGRPLFISV